MEAEPIKAKFESYPSVFWAKMIRAKARKEDFTEPEPPTNWKENVTYHMKEIKNFFSNLAKKGKEKFMTSKDQPMTNTNTGYNDPLRQKIPTVGGK